MDPVEEECQARRAEEQAQQYALLQNVPPAPVWNRERGKGERRFYMTPVHVPQNLDDGICKGNWSRALQEISQINYTL